MTLHGAKAVVPFCLFCIIKLFYDTTEAYYEFFCVSLQCEVTKRVYFIGNERMLIAHDSNRLRFS